MRYACPMNISDSLLPGALLLFAYGVWLPVLFQAFRAAPWRPFLASAKLQHLFLGATLVLFLLWSFEIGVRPALGFHFLGVTVYVLMFGWSLGVLGVSLAMVAVTFATGDWAALAINALLLGVLPVSISYSVYALVTHYLPRHLFIYIFLCAFFNAMLTAGAAALALALLLIVTETYTVARISNDYLPYLPLYLFPEGLLNGMVITALIGLRPDWLKTYDDELYLKG